MKITLAVFLIILIRAPAHALDFDPFEGPKPIIVLIQTNPSAIVIGSDTPVVAVYEDGQVVYQNKNKAKPPVLHHKRLGPQAFADFKKKLSSFGNYTKLKGDYIILTSWTDQPWTKIYLSLDGVVFTTRVYGLFRNKQKSNALPKAIKDLHTYLTSLDFVDAKPWEPLYVEAIIRRYDYAPAESIHWPKDWPGLSSPSALKRGNAYSIFLPGKDIPKIRKFLKTRNKGEAVEIGGKKWAISVRYTFPSEPIWFKAFRR